MDGGDEYVRKWENQEDADVETLSEWVKYIRHLIRDRVPKRYACEKNNTSMYFLTPFRENVTHLHDK